MARRESLSSGEPAEIKLTPKQEAFALAYHELGNASEAYRRSYNAENMKAGVIYNKASLLLKRGDIRVRLGQLQSEAAERNEMTVDRITEMLLEDRKMARTNQQAAAAATCSMGLAKLHGLIVDKSKADVDQRTTHDLEGVSKFAECIGRAKRSRSEGDT